MHKQNKLEQIPSLCGSDGRDLYQESDGKSAGAHLSPGAPLCQSRLLSLETRLIRLDLHTRLTDPGKVTVSVVRLLSQSNNDSLQT